MNLQESGEMYLETILRLTDSRAGVRSIDVCDEMGFSKPSVSRAIGLLKSGGYVEVSPEGFLSLTVIGREVAMKVYARHKLITELLTFVGVPEEIAVADACKIEHCISDASFAKIKEYIEKKKDR
ncbi:MAG: metal-dependent transcriptional regulator [Clostridia bacterium]|nr:metal-dependent transcriptional regulator [Clostridia bacterium]